MPRRSNASKLPSRQLIDSVFRCELPSRLSVIAGLTRELAAWARANGVPERVMHSASLVLDELFTNVVVHGYGQRADERVLVEARMQDGALVIGITDFAPAFDPLLVPLPDTSLPLEARQPGGLGLLFVRRTADELHYRRVEGTGSPACNRVWFSKRLRPELTPSGSPGSVVA